jgi:hypothetical protein
MAGGVVEIDWLVSRSRPLPTRCLSIAGGFKNDRHRSIATRGTHEARLQPREGEVWASRGHQRLKVQLLAVDALPH